MGIIGCWINRRAADETGKQRERERVCMGSERERECKCSLFLGKERVATMMSNNKKSAAIRVII